MNLTNFICTVSKLWLVLHAIVWCDHVHALTIEPGYVNNTEDTDAHTSTITATTTPLLFDLAVSTTDMTTKNVSILTPLDAVKFSCNYSQEDFNTICLNETTTEHNSGGFLFENIYEAKVYLFMIDYYFYFTNIPGFITNPLAIMMAIFARPFNTTELYILVLSISDLLVNLSRFVCSYVGSFNISWNDHGCRACIYLPGATSVFSNFIIVCWTIERLYAVLYPLKLFALFSIGRVKVALIVLLFSAYALSIPYTFSFYAGKSVARDVVVCYHTKFISTWSHFEAFYIVIIPVGIVVVSNMIIIKTIYTSGKRRKQWTNNTSILERRRHEQARLAITLVLISAVFVLLQIPYLLALIWDILYPDPLVIFQNSHVDFVRFVLYTGLGFIIPEILNWANLFIYILSGKKFRDAFLRILCLTRSRTVQKRADFTAHYVAEFTME